MSSKIFQNHSHYKYIQISPEDAEGHITNSNTPKGTTPNSDTPKGSLSLRDQLSKIEDIDPRNRSSEDLEKEIKHQFKNLGKFYLDNNSKKLAIDCLCTAARKSMRIHQYCLDFFNKLKGDQDTLVDIKLSLLSVVPSKF